MFNRYLDDQKKHTHKIRIIYPRKIIYSEIHPMIVCVSYPGHMRNKNATKMKRLDKVKLIRVSIIILVIQNTTNEANETYSPKSCIEGEKIRAHLFFFQSFLKPTDMASKVRL